MKEKRSDSVRKGKPSLSLLLSHTLPMKFTVSIICEFIKVAMLTVGSGTRPEITSCEHISLCHPQIQERIHLLPAMRTKLLQRLYEDLMAHCSGPNTPYSQSTLHRTLQGTQLNAFSKSKTHISLGLLLKLCQRCALKTSRTGISARLSQHTLTICLGLSVQNILPQV